MNGIGITYNNVHSGRFNTKTILDHSIEGDLFVPSIDVVSSENTYAHGGNYHRTRYSTKTKKLSLFFEGLEQEKLYQMINWISKTGKSELIFDDIPFLTLDVVLSKEPDIKIYWQGGKVGGTIDLTFSLYSPFKRINVSTLDDVAPEYQSLAKQMTRLIPKDANDKIILESGNSSDGFNLFAHNSGTTYLPINISCSFAQDIKISNTGTGEVLLGIGKQGSSGEWVNTAGINFDGRSERTYFVSPGGAITYGFDSHGGDYIGLSGHSFEKNQYIMESEIKNGAFPLLDDNKINPLDASLWMIYINEAWHALSSSNIGSGEIVNLGAIASDGIYNIILTKIDRLVTYDNILEAKIEIGNGTLL